ncbi:hypothetical protein Pla163_07020 [Planctomycetes bacterium Pla163]|uniref:DUF4139 domain-containing protein n=1 Tax=Rohdeia mirabilis TaxID=2528008 RepID=A0A518CWL2_9BACT|nr:hypothetical protein Pla163_07020 [Planctomycetes bacterium Pla163]
MIHSLALCALALACPPSDSEPGVLDGRATRVQAYKNGVALVSMRLVGTADADGALAFELPDAGLLEGGAWIEGPRAPREVRAGAEERTTRRPCATLFETLEANVGNDVVLVWAPRAVQSAVPSFISGRIQHVSDPGGVDVYGRPNVQAAGVVVLRQTDGTTRTLPLGDVLSISGGDLRHTIAETELGAWSLELTTEPNSEFTCDLQFLARGIDWRAVYRLDGDLEGEDELTVAYELKNELVDLEGTTVHLVAGEANFTRDGSLSFLSGLSPSTRDAEPQQQWSQQIGNFANNSLRAGAPTSAPSESRNPSSSDGDLTRLPLGAVDLARGGRALLRTTTSPARVDHLYTLDLDVRRGSENGVEIRDAFGAPERWEPAYRGGYVEYRRSKAWHRLTLANSGPLPWTTGPLLVVRALEDGPFPLAQETLRYTPAGDIAEVPLNLALGLETEFWEESLPTLDRKDGAAAVTGRLVLTNRIGETIRVRTRLGLGGQVTVTEGDARVSASPGRDADWTGTERANWRWHREENPHSQIEWTIELDAGASATLAYESTFDLERR